MSPAAGRSLAISSGTTAGWVHVLIAKRIAWQSQVVLDMAIVVTYGSSRELLDSRGSEPLLWDEDLSRDTGMEGWLEMSF